MPPHASDPADFSRGLRSHVATSLAGLLMNVPPFPPPIPRCGQGAMQRITTLAALWFLASCTAPSPVTREHPILLPPSQAMHALEQCSRESPQSVVDGTWAIPSATITQLEEDLPKLSALGTDHWGATPSSAWDSHAYFRQYAGITIHGKKYVYINAFSDLPIYLKGQDTTRWQREPVLVCDGGEGFWGALYDPDAKQFSQLAFNGPG